MGTVALLFIWFLYSPDLGSVHRVDRIERNIVHSRRGDIVLDQFIFWRYCNRCGEFRSCGWALSKYCVVQKKGDNWLVIVWFERRRVRYTAKDFCEVHSLVDRELGRRGDVCCKGR